MSTSPTRVPKIHTSRSPNETIALGKALAARHPEGACFYLEGDLGSGKTLLTKGIAAGYGIPDDRVVSPTFALVNRYSGSTRTLYHIDLYRLENPRELEELGLEELGEELAGGPTGAGAVIVVEWSEKLDALGGYRRPNAVQVRLEALEGGARRIQILETEAAGAKT